MPLKALMKYRGRLSKLVDRFEDRGLSFDAYLASSLRYLARTVRRDRRLKTDRELVCERMAASSYGEDEGSGFGEKGGTDLCSHPPIGAGARRTAEGRSVGPRARGGSLPKPAKAASSSLAIKCAWGDRRGGASSASPPLQGLILPGSARRSSRLAVPSFPNASA